MVSLNLLYRKAYLVSLSDLLVQSLCHRKLLVVSLQFTSSSISLKNRTEAYITLVTEMQLLLFLFPFFCDKTNIDMGKVQILYQYFSFEDRMSRLLNTGVEGGEGNLNSV